MEALICRLPVSIKVTLWILYFLFLTSQDLVWNFLLFQLTLKPVSPFCNLFWNMGCPYFNKISMSLFYFTKSLWYSILCNSLSSQIVILRFFDSRTFSNFVNEPLLRIIIYLKRCLNGEFLAKRSCCKFCVEFSDIILHD